MKKKNQILKIFITLLISNLLIKSVYASNMTVNFESTWWYTVTTTETWTNTDWIRDNSDQSEWSFSISSADWLNDNDTWCFEITNNVTTASETLSFDYKVSSEVNYDFLRFYIDWNQEDEWSWTIDWTNQQYQNLDIWNHTFRWCFEKDVSVSNWDDKSFIDNITVTWEAITIPNQVFHFNWTDINWDWDITNNPSEGWNVTPWVDLINWYNATAWTAPLYESESIKTYSWVVFDWTKTLSIWNQSTINTSTFDEKSFWIIFQTWDDITTLQNIYEQWWGTRWYAIQIEGWKVYAWVWNNAERASWDQYKSLSANITPNTSYRLIMIQDSTDATLVNRTFEVILDWVSLWVLSSVDVQKWHSWWIELGSSDWTRKLSDTSNLWWAWSFFKWSIWEFASWNHALTSQEVNTINTYLYDKWLAREFPKWPWWVESTIQFWLKADAWTSTTTDWNSLSSWSDQSWNWFDATWWVSPTYFNNTTNLNFNPVIDFNWTDQYLQNLSNWAYTQSYFAVIVPDNKIDWTITWQVPLWFDCNSWTLNTGSCWLTFWWLTIWAFTAAINDELITHAIWSSTWWRSAQIWTASYEANKPMLINMNENSSWNWTEISEKWLQLDNYDANTYQTLSSADYRIWMSSDSSYPFPYDWKIAEIINYNSRINNTEKQKIESYLALKYWMTLDSWNKDYLASNWSTVYWNSSLAWSYTNNVFGIGRDEISELWQIKSKSVNSDNIITMEAISEWTNISPSFVDINNLEFLTISNNYWWNTWSATDSPSSYNILSRKWLVQETWELWMVNLEFNLANPNFDVPDLSAWTSYYFLYDSNNNNSLSDETPQAMINTTWDIWITSWMDLDNLREFTIATLASTNNIPTDISLSNNIINENLPIWSNIWNFSTSDLDSWDSHTYSFISWTWDDDNNRFSILWSTISINESPDFEIKDTYNVRIQTDDWNWGAFQKAFTININDIWETITSLIDFEDADDENKYSITSWSWTRTTTSPQEWSYSIESQINWQASTQTCFEINHTFLFQWTIDFQYKVSSQSNWDYLRFYIDNIEQQVWSWEIDWSLYTDTNINSWTHKYKWCYIKNQSTNSWSDKVWIDYIKFYNSTIDSTPPNISSINYLSWSLLPWWNHNIIINYIDSESWINITSDSITLNKWSWSSWWTDISSTWLNLSSKTISATSASYPTDNLIFWKYRYNFNISDNNSNSSSTWSVFYIDEPELIISTWSIDIWWLKEWVTKFSNEEINITVKTVWAWFDVILNKESSLTNWSIEIIDWNWIEWIWFEKSPYTSTVNLINTNEIIASELKSININWNKNTYNYSIKLWAQTSEQQAAWNYNWNIKFWIDLDY